MTAASTTNPTTASESEALPQTPVHKYFYSMIELGIVRIFAERGIFDAIPDEGDISVQELANKTDSEFALLNRFINFLVMAGALKSSAPGRVAHTETSQVFKYEKAVIFLMHVFDFFMGPATRWSEYFKANGFREPECSNTTPLGLFSGHPNKSLYQVMELWPDRVERFNRTMAETIDEMPMTGFYDFTWIGEYAANNDDKERILFVDVGSGKGQALKSILEENPTIPAARCAMQDQANAIKEAITEDDVVLQDTKKVASSFFEPQLIKGALVYHIRRVLNDWADKDALKILKHAADACAKDSRVLVSEQLLPDEPTSLDLAAMDIWMLNFAGKRRTQAMFKELALQAGLKVTAISQDKASLQAMIEMMPI